MNKEDKIGLIIILVYIEILVLILISIASAEIIYSGESVTIPLDFEIVNCSVINSNNNLEGLNLSWRGKNIIISTHPQYKSDNLTISCWIMKYGEVVEYYYDGGSSCIYDKNFNWNCSGWSECINLKQNRTCKKYNNCGNTYGKPNQKQVCVIAKPIVEIPPINDTIIPPINLPPKSWLSKYKWWLIIYFFIIFLIITFIIYRIFTKKYENVNKNF